MKYFPDSPWYLQAELLLTVKRDAEMLIRLLRNAASARRSREKALLQQVWLIDILERDRFLIDRCRQRLDADGAAAVVFDDGVHHPVVDGV